MRRKGSCKVAHELVTKAVTTRERTLSHDNVDTLTSVSTLALVLLSQGKYEETEKMTRRALE
jgi:hypothetical protein